MIKIYTNIRLRTTCIVVYIVKSINLEDLINLITVKTNLIFRRLIIAYWDVGKRMTQCPVPKNGLMKMYIQNQQWYW